MMRQHVICGELAIERERTLEWMEGRGGNGGSMAVHGDIHRKGEKRKERKEQYAASYSLSRSTQHGPEFKYGKWKKRLTEMTGDENQRHANGEISRSKDRLKNFRAKPPYVLPTFTDAR